MHFMMILRVREPAMHHFLGEAENGEPVFLSRPTTSGSRHWKGPANETCR